MIFASSIEERIEYGQDEVSELNTPAAIAAIVRRGLKIFLNYRLKGSLPENEIFQRSAFFDNNFGPTQRVLRTLVKLKSWEG